MLGKKSSVSNSPVAIIARIDNYVRFEIWEHSQYELEQSKSRMACFTLKKPSSSSSNWGLLYSKRSALQQGFNAANEKLIRVDGVKISPIFPELCHIQCVTVLYGNIHTENKGKIPHRAPENFKLAGN